MIRYLPTTYSDDDHAVLLSQHFDVINPFIKTFCLVFFYNFTVGTI